MSNSDKEIQATFITENVTHNLERRVFMFISQNYLNRNYIISTHYCKQDAYDELNNCVLRKQKNSQSFSSKIYSSLSTTTCYFHMLNSSIGQKAVFFSMSDSEVNIKQIYLLRSSELQVLQLNIVLDIFQVPNENLIEQRKHLLYTRNATKDYRPTKTVNINSATNQNPVQCITASNTLI